MNAELMKLYPRGCSVNVSRTGDDSFNNDFTGTVIGYHNGYVTVSDKDGDCWDVEQEQISLAEGETETVDFF